MISETLIVFQNEGSVNIFTYNLIPSCEKLTKRLIKTYGDKIINFKPILSEFYGWFGE